jgi:hypothetical protein
MVFSDSSSQLDSIETSIHSRIPSTYQEWLTKDIELEWVSALGLYAQVDDDDSKSRLPSLLDCRRFAWFYWNRVSGKVRCVANACRLRWCPLCSRARYNLIRHSVEDWLKRVRNAKFFTVTLRHDSDPLPAQIDRLYEAFRLFRRYKTWQNRVRGGIWFFQVKRSRKDGCWHSHLHILLDSDYIPKKELSLEWLKATGNSFIIDIRKVEDPEKASEYVARYCSRPAKLSEFSKEDQYQLFYGLHGKRLFGSFGSGRECRFRPAKTPDFLDWQKIDTWSSIIGNIQYRQCCKRIARAFFTDSAVDKQTVELSTAEWLRDENLPISRPVIEHKQGFFEEFVKR